MYPLTSFEAVEVVDLGNGIFRLQIQKDNGVSVKIADSKNKDLLLSTWTKVSEFMQTEFK